VILATPSAQSLELAGPVEVFAMATAKLREAGREHNGGYSVEVVSATDDLVIKSSSGLTILAHHCWRNLDRQIDTFLVAGGMEIWTGADQPDFLPWIREQAKNARRFGSICTGAFVLAEAGLLTHRRVTLKRCRRRQPWSCIIVYPPTNGKVVYQGAVLLQVVIQPSCKNES
jgi:transcriptional regulator GlxA family with amidase domain